MTTAQLPLPHLGPQARLLLDRIIGAGRDGIPRADLVDWVLGRLLKLGYVTEHPSDPSAVVQTQAGLRRWQIELLEEERREADKLRRQLTRERVEARFRAMQAGFPVPAGPRPPILAGLPAPQRPALPAVARSQLLALRHEPVDRPPIQLPVAGKTVLALPPSLVPRPEAPARVKAERKRRGKQGAAMIAASTAALLLVGASVHAGLWSSLVSTPSSEPSAAPPEVAASPMPQVQPAVEQAAARPEQAPALSPPERAGIERAVTQPEQVAQAAASVPHRAEPAPAPPATPSVVKAAEDTAQASPGPLQLGPAQPVSPVQAPMLPSSVLIDPPPAPAQIEHAAAVSVPADTASEPKQASEPQPDQVKVPDQQTASSALASNQPAAEAKPAAAVVALAAQTTPVPDVSADAPLISLPESKVAPASMPEPPPLPPMDTKAEASATPAAKPAETASSTAPPAPVLLAQLPSLPLEPLPAEAQQPVMTAEAEAAPIPEPKTPQPEMVAALQEEPSTAVPDTPAEAPPHPERHADVPDGRAVATAAPPHVRHHTVAAIVPAKAADLPAKPANPLDKDHERVEHLNELSLAAAKRGVEWRPRG